MFYIGKVALGVDTGANWLTFTGKKVLAGDNLSILYFYRLFLTPHLPSALLFLTISDIS
jgi:hypothetical protein